MPDLGNLSPEVVLAASVLGARVRETWSRQGLWYRDMTHHKLVLTEKFVKASRRNKAFASFAKRCQKKKTPGAQFQILDSIDDALAAFRSQARAKKKSQPWQRITVLGPLPKSIAKKSSGSEQRMFRSLSEFLALVGKTRAEKSTPGSSSSSSSS